MKRSGSSPRRPTGSADHSPSNWIRVKRTKEEVDGLVTLGWQGFLIQSKLEADPTPFDPIARLYLQVGRRPRGTIGLVLFPGLLSSGRGTGGGVAPDSRPPLPDR